MATVALVRCESYEYDKVRTAVRTGIDLLGGPGLFANRREDPFQAELARR